MSGKIEEHLRLPLPASVPYQQVSNGGKRQEMYSTLIGLHNKIDSITDKIRHCKANKTPFDMPNNVSSIEKKSIKSMQCVFLILEQ